jgi:hypothetical protein
MTTTMLSTAVVVSQPVFSDAERVALSGYLAGYNGLTKEAYALDLRQFATWCEEHNVRLFEGGAGTSSASVATSRSAAGLARRLPGGFARSPASTATQSRRSLSNTHQRSMSACWR